MTGLEIAFGAAALAGAAMSAMGTMQQQQSAARQQMMVARQQQQQALSLQYQAAELDYNAVAADRDAKQARVAAALKMASIETAGERQQGTVRARAAASGLSISDGSPLELLADNASAIELDRLAARYEGDVTAKRFESEALLSRYRAGQARDAAEFGYETADYSAASARETMSFAPISAAGTFLSQAGGVYKAFRPTTGARSKSFASEVSGGAPARNAFGGRYMGA